MWILYNSCKITTQKKYKVQLVKSTCVLSTSYIIKIHCLRELEISVKLSWLDFQPKWFFFFIHAWLIIFRFTNSATKYYIWLCFKNSLCSYSFFPQRHIASSYNSWPYITSKVPIQSTKFNLDMLWFCNILMSFSFGDEPMAS